MGSCVFRCEVIGIEDRTLTLVITVVDGQSIAGMSAGAMPRSAAFGLQLLVETTWTALDVAPALQVFAAGDPDAAALLAAAERFVVDYANESASGFPIHAPGWEYNEWVERGSLEPGRLRAAMTVTDAAYLRHLAPGWGWDSPCGALFE
jgi:hypothetical protein